MIKRYPFITSATSLLAARFKFPVLAAATKWGGAATVGYKLWELWQKNHPGPDAGSRLARRPDR